MEDSTVVVVSYSGKEINAKLVYYGAGLSGKTTNLESIYEAVPESSRGKMVSMKTQSDRTLFFDLLPLDLGEIMGFKTRFLLYTVPGQVFYNATRKLVLKGADAIVFVADSEVGKMDENKESLANLRANLSEYGLNLDETPWVIQYNKRDLPNVYSIEELNRELNPGGVVPYFDAVATHGKGVFETFRGVSQLLMEKVTKELHRAPLSGSAPRPAAKPGPAPAPAAGAAGGILDLKIPSPRAPAAPVTPAAATAPEIAREQAIEPAQSFPFHYGRELTLSPTSPTPDPGVQRLSVEPRLDDSARPMPRSLTSEGGAGRETAATKSPAGLVTGSPRASATEAPPLELEPEVSSTSPMRPGMIESRVAGLAPAGESAGSTDPAATQEVVVPVVLPRRGTREIVLRIVLSDGT